MPSHSEAPPRDAVLKSSSHPPSLRSASKNKPSEKSFIGAFGQLPKRGSTVGNLRRSGTPLRRSSSAQSKILRTSRIPRLAAPLALENPARPCPVVRTISVIRKGSTPLPQAPPVGPETSRCAHVRCAHSYVCMLCRQGLANRGVCNALPCRVGAPRGGHVSLGMTRGTAGATPGKNLIQSIYKNIMKAYIKQEETKREDRWSCPDVGGTNEAI